MQEISKNIRNTNSEIGYAKAALKAFFCTTCFNLCFEHPQVFAMGGQGIVIAIVEFVGLFATFLFCEKTASALAEYKTYLLCAFLALFAVIGIAYDNYNTLGVLMKTKTQILKAVLLLGGYFVLFKAIISKLYDFCRKKEVVCIFESKIKECKTTQWYGFLLDNNTFLTIFLTIVILSIPEFIFSYPGQFMGDTNTQIAQMFANADGYLFINNHHPIVHTVLIHVCIMLVRAIGGSWNTGIFLYVCVQAAIIISAYAYMLTFAKKRGLASNFGITILVLYFCLHARIQSYLMLVTKDVIFTASMILFCVNIFRIILGENEKRVYMALFFSALGMILFRNDGVYIVLPVTIMLCFREYRYRYRNANHKAAFLLTACLLLFFFAWNRAILPALNVSPGEEVEMLSIPIQQTARCVRDRSNFITEEEREIIDAVLPYDEIGELYNPNIADPVKGRFKTDGPDNAVTNYLYIWKEMSIKYPDVYVQAFLNNKYQYFWFSAPENNFNYEWSSTVMERINQRCAHLGMSFSHPARLSKARLTFEKIREGIAEFPIFNLFLTSSFYIWLFLIWSVYEWIEKNKNASLFMLLFFMQLLVILAGPTNGYYFRYTYPLAVCLPFAITFTCGLRHHEECLTT